MLLDWCGWWQHAAWLQAWSCTREVTSSRAKPTLSSWVLGELLPGSCAAAESVLPEWGVISGQIAAGPGHAICSRLRRLTTQLLCTWLVLLTFPTILEKASQQQREGQPAAA